MKKIVMMVDADRDSEEVKVSGLEMDKRFYEILYVDPKASHNDVVHAYNKAKQAFSSGSVASYSVFDESDNKKLLVEIEEAFAILGNPSKRREYDMAHGYDQWSSSRKKRKKKKYQQQLQQPNPFQAEKDVHLEDEELVQESEQISVTHAAPLSVVQDSVHAEAPGESVSNHEPNQNFQEQIDHCQSVTGDFMRAVRVFRHLSIEQVASACKLSPRVVQKIENEDIADLEYQAVYLRGHIYMMCQTLDLPQAGLLAQTFVERMKIEGRLSPSQF